MMRVFAWRLSLFTCALVGSGCDSGTTGDGGSGSGSETAEVVLTTGNSTVKDGGKFWTPLDNGTSTLNLFTEQKDIWTLRNKTSADIKVDTITVKAEAGVQTEEFQIYDNLIPSKAAKLENIVVKAGATYEFQIRFYPVASGERKAVATVAYDGSKKVAFTLTGKGQTNATFFSGGTVKVGAAAMSRVAASSSECSAEPSNALSRLSLAGGVL